MLQNLIDIVTAPQAAFNSLKEKPNAFLPLLLIVFMVGLTQLIYFSNVDAEFLIDQLVEQVSSFVAVPEGELREQLAQSNPASQGISSAISAAIFVPIMMLMYASFLTLVSKFTSDEIGFKRWFSLVTWAGIPAVFSAVAGIIVVLMSSDGMISLMQLKPFSLNNLIFQTSGPFETLLGSLDLTQIWTITLMTLGYQSWTGKSLLKSFILAAFPYLLIYGIWVLIIL